MSWIRRGTPEWRGPGHEDADNTGKVWVIWPGVSRTPVLRDWDKVFTDLDDVEAWHPKPVCEPPPYTPPEPAKPKGIVAYATRDAVLYLFDDAAAFRRWSMDGEWSQGGWVKDCVGPDTAAARIKAADDVERLRKDAAEDIAFWGAYAGEHAQQEWDLAGCVAKYRREGRDDAE